MDDFPGVVQESSAAAHSIDEDEALARQLMQEEVDNSGSGNGNSDGVRSPIAARQDILVHPDMDYDQAYGYPSRGRGNVPVKIPLLTQAHLLAVSLTKLRHRYGTRVIYRHPWQRQQAVHPRPMTKQIDLLRCIVVHLRSCTVCPWRRYSYTQTS